MSERTGLEYALKVISKSKYLFTDRNKVDELVREIDIHKGFNYKIIL